MSSMRHFAVAALVAAASVSADVRDPRLRGAVPDAICASVQADPESAPPAVVAYCANHTAALREPSPALNDSAILFAGLAAAAQCGPCGSPSERCFWDARCSSQGSDPFGGAGCKADGVHTNCRFCDTGSNVPQCPVLAQPPALGSGTSRSCAPEWVQNNNWGSNYNGNNPDRTDVTSSQCKDACQSASFDCKGWTWLGSCGNGNGCCYLKPSVGDMRYDAAGGTSMASGYCYQNCGDAQEKQNNWGQNLGSGYHVDNMEFCKKDCEAKGGWCRGWTVTNDNTCYLKSSVSGFQRDDGVQASGNC